MILIGYIFTCHVWTVNREKDIIKIPVKTKKVLNHFLVCEKFFLTKFIKQDC